jgi:hypothetical protein
MKISNHSLATNVDTRVIPSHIIGLYIIGLAHKEEEEEELPLKMIPETIGHQDKSSS